MNLTYRLDKGSALTAAEHDDNLRSVYGRPSVKFLTSDANQSFDVSTAEYGTWRTGASWTASRTITFSGTPPDGAWFLFSNNSGQDIYLANGAGSPLDLPVLPFYFRKGGTILLETFDSTSKLIKVDRGSEQSTDRYPPFGGGKWRFLAKNSSADHDFAWLDHDDFTLDSNPDTAADFLMTYDVSSGEPRKVLLGSAASKAAINSQSGTAYTLALTDAGKLVTMNNASANALTVPANASVAFPVGTRIEIASLGAGQTTVVAGGGVTVNPSASLALAGQYSTAWLRKIATDSWLLSGSIAAP